METTRALTRSVPCARLSRLVAATAIALSLSAAPAFAADEPGGEDPAVEEAGPDGAEGAAEDEGGRIQLAETPRDRVGLMVLGFLGAITVGAALTMNRQLKGERPQASGEFRWR
jgi:hypothetical protein